MATKNITVSVDEETHRRARIRAAEMGISLSALVRDCLQSLCNQPADVEAPKPMTKEEELKRRRKAIEEVVNSITANGGGLLMSENLTREELYEEAWRERNAIR